MTKREKYKLYQVLITSMDLDEVLDDGASENYENIDTMSKMLKVPQFNDWYAKKAFIREQVYKLSKELK